ncbi:MAG: hypothetical protein AAB455_01180, partial [Patescibacteria group bacterium]
TQGFTGGTLTCNNLCQFNTTQCTGTDNGGNPSGDTPGWHAPPGAPPACDDVNVPGCWPPINVSSRFQSKVGSLQVGGLIALLGSKITGGVDYGLPGNLLLGVNGRVGATEYCDQLGQNCYPITALVGGEGAGVSRIIAGSNITISPAGGTGAVTINSSGGSFDSSGITNCTNSISNKIYWDGTKLVCGGDQTGAPGGGITSLVGQNGISASVSGTSGTIGLDTTRINNCTDSGSKIVWSSTERRLTCLQDSPSGASYSADEESLTKSATNVFSVKDNGITSAKIANDAVGASEIADGAVNTPHLDNDAVTMTKLAIDSVSTSKIVDNAVTSAKLGFGLQPYVKTTDMTRSVLGKHKLCAITAMEQRGTASVAMQCRLDLVYSGSDPVPTWDITVRYASCNVICIN